MKTLFVLLLALCVCSATHHEEAFQKFKVDYGKSYDEVEENYRFTIFQQNIQKAEENNLKQGKEIFGVTKFADLTSEEFKSVYLNYRPRGRLETDVISTNHHTPITQHKFDWRDAGVVTPVKDQGQCGSCWAFSAVEGIESQWAIKNRTLLELSPQQLVSCDNKGPDYGCEGGDLPTAYSFMMKCGGLQTEKDYPYTSGASGRDGPCLFDKKKVAVSIKNYTYATTPCFDSCDKQNEYMLLYNLIRVAPPAVCVHADPFQMYVSGVLETDCVSDYPSLDHCTQLIGINKDDKGLYWIMRNSWGTSWGEQGYINLRFGKNLCGVADEAMFVSFH